MGHRTANRAGIRELRALRPFATCSDRELELIDSVAAHLDVSAGQGLTQEGQVGRESFLVLSGTASVARGGTVIATLREGDFIGEMALLDNRPRSATVTATTPMVLLVFDSRTFSSALESSTFARLMLRGLAQRMRSLEPATV